MYRFADFEVADDNQLRVYFDKGFGITQSLRLDLNLDFQPGAGEAIAQILGEAEAYAIEPLVVDGELTGDIQFQATADPTWESLSDRLIAEGLASLKPPPFSGSWNDLSDRPSLNFLSAAGGILSGPLAILNDFWIDTASPADLALAGEPDGIILNSSKPLLCNVSEGLHLVSDFVAAQINSSASTFYQPLYADLVAVGQGSGSVALTVNDGGGNANLCFNHANTIPDVSGVSGRITVNVDQQNTGAGSAFMSFQFQDGVSAGVPISLPNQMRLSSVWLVPGADDAQFLGLSHLRWKQLHAVNGSIVTSDQREKANIRSLSEPELRVAIRLQPQIFQWAAIVEHEGEAARLHCGAIAQEVLATFEAEGLDPYAYSLNCRDFWWEFPGGTANTFEDVPVEHQAVAVERDRLGVRVSELSAFVLAGVQQQIQNLSSRVAALEEKVVEHDS